MPRVVEKRGSKRGSPEQIIQAYTVPLIQILTRRELCLLPKKKRITPETILSTLEQSSLRLPELQASVYPGSMRRSNNDT